MFNPFKKTALVAAAGLAFVATPALAADGNPATATGTGKVRILQPLSIDATGGLLDFGVLVKGTAVAAASYYSFTVDNTGAFAGCDAAWACSAAKDAADFTVTGAAGESVQVTVQSVVDLDGVSGATNDFLSVALTLSGDTDIDDDANLVLTGGTAAFSVGGTLTVRGDVAPNTYTAPFNVSAEYL